MNIKKSILKETVDRGNTPIPVYIYHQIQNKYILYLHWHNEIEMIYIERGSLIFTVDMVPIKVSEGQCIIINSGQLHSAHYTDDTVSIHHALLFELNFLSSADYDYCQKKYIDPLLNAEYRFPLVVDEKSGWGQSVIKEVKEALKICDLKEQGWEIGIKASLYKIIFLVAQSGKFVKEKITSSSNYKINLIKKSLHYIQSNYLKKIYIDDIAKEVNLNPQYFCKFFKANIGKTPVDYINQYRIGQAAKIMRMSDKKISEICFDVGFENFSYFIKKFKQYKGYTPGVYRYIR